MPYAQISFSRIVAAAVVALASAVLSHAAGPADPDPADAVYRLTLTPAQAGGQVLVVQFTCADGIFAATIGAAPAALWGEAKGVRLKRFGPSPPRAICRKPAGAWCLRCA